MGWQTLWSGSVNTNTTGWAGWTVVNRFEAGILADIQGVTKIRVRFVPSTAQQAAITDFYIGHQAASGDAYDFDGGQVSLGSGTVAANTPTTFTANFAYDYTKDLLVGFSLSSTGSSSIRRGSNTSGVYYQRNLANDAGTTNKASYSTGAAGNFASIDLIEVYVPDLLDAAVGSYTVTGIDAGVGVNSVSAATGTIAVAGQDAITKKGSVVTAEPVEVVVAGQDANVIPGKKVTADVGAITVLGVAAGIIASRNITADPGAISVAGQSAALPLSILAATGAISVAGQTANVLATRSVVAAPGAISVTGVAAITKRALNVAADPGVISVSGQDAALRGGFKVVANAGAVAVSGVAADGIFGLTGNWYPLWRGDNFTGGGESGGTNQTKVMLFGVGLLADISNSTQIRFLFGGIGTGSQDVVADKVYTDHGAASGDAYDFEALGIQVTFSGSPGYTITPGNTLLSDAIPFSYDPSKPLAVALYHSGFSYNSYLSSGGITGLNFYNRAGDEAATVNKTTGYSASTDTQQRFIQRIDVYIPPGPVLVAETGAISALGVAAAVAASRLVVANQGTVIVTGQDAITRRSYLALAADTGAVSVSGQDIEMYAGKFITADPGAYGLAGQAAGVTTTRVLYGDVGAISVLGQAAIAKIGFRVQAELGTFAVSGEPAIFDLDRAIVANPGAITVTGQVAITRYGHRLFADPGAISVLGQDAANLNTRRITADRGLISVSGQVAGLQFHHKVASNPGAYVVNGIAAAMVRGRPMVAAPGAYQVVGAEAVVRPALRRRSVGAIAS